MRKKRMTNNQIAIYQTKTGGIEVRKDVRAGTLWAAQGDIVKLYDKSQPVISRHIQSIFRDGEVDRERNMQKMHIPNSDKPLTLYSLDIILAVGYRTNSKRAIEFRKWATKTLKQYIVDGYAINRHRIAENYAQFLSAVENLKQHFEDTHQTLAIVKV
ncbi:MAG: RhuM family protein [Candidatus Uhrbacteria bacterium]|nr:RhuM family protein [Candidatus Uhrbacteria bacterium]